MIYLEEALTGHELHHQHARFAGLFRIVGGDDVADLL
jgi:hypothetical protein